jgi:hypothetical protein
MARYGASILSQAAQLSGVNATTTVNGYLGYWGGSATSGFRLRRLQLGVIAGAGVPTSQQISIGIYRQTVAPAGTGLAAAVLGQPLETWTPQTDPTTGIIATTATTIGTTGPTLAANPIAVRSRALPTKSSSTICTSGSPTSATANIALPSWRTSSGSSFWRMAAASSSPTNIIRTAARSTPE